VQLVEETSPLMDEKKVDDQQQQQQQGVLVKRTKKKGLTWGCVNSWLLRDGPFPYTHQHFHFSPVFLYFYSYLKHWTEISNPVRVDFVFVSFFCMKKI
jgi:hypothetical protein